MAKKQTPRQQRTLPGLSLALGYTLFALGVVVLLPLSLLFAKAASGGWGTFFEAAFAPRALAAYRLSFGTAMAAAAVDVAVGTLVAWVLVRYTFPGRRLIDALVDLPFALPTAVAGITLTTLYSQNGWVGQWLYRWGISSAYTPLGITIALTFIGLPFVVRTLQPVLQEIDIEVEEAAASLGAGRWDTLRRVIFPGLLPAVITGFTLAFARGIGEYGSVIFIAGNMPGKTEVAPLLIMTQLEQYHYAGAAGIAVVMLLVSFALLGVTYYLHGMAARSSGMD